MAELFKCPACSAPLTYEGNPIQQCTFCNSNVIVPGSVINAAAPDRHAGATAFGNMAPIDELAGQLKDVKRLLSEGKKIEAIKVFRETFGCGLKEAKDAVEAIERGENVTLTKTQYGSQALIDGATAKKVGLAVGGSFIFSFIIGFAVIAAIIVVAVVFISSTVSKTTRTFPTPERIVTVSSPARPSEPASIAQEILKFGGEGIGAGKFKDNRTIAVDSDGRIYSADFSNGRVQAFDAEGNFLQQYVPDATRTVDSLGVDRKGSLFVLQGYDVYRLNRVTGEVYGKTRIDQATDLAVGADGKIYVAARRGDIAVLNSDGVKVTSVPLSKELGIDAPDQIAVDGASNIYLVSGHDAAIFKLAPNGKLLAKFGGRAADRDSKSKFSTTPFDIAVDSQGRIYAAEVSRVRIFDANGNYLNEFRTTQVLGLTLNDKDELFVAARPFVIKYKVTF